MSRTTVNRYLKDKQFDLIDHAIGRPVNPLVESYRNYFATDKNSTYAKQFAASPFWALNGIRDDMAYYRVTQAGREALDSHLKEIGDNHRLYDVTYEGHTSSVAATSPGNAKYSLWLDISDFRCELQFGAFARSARVRLTPAALAGKALS